jgi:hypothetical protein
MSHAPKIPKEQRSFADKGARSEVEAETADRRDARTNVKTGQPGDADINTGQQGRYGDIKQNTTHQGYQQDR